MVDNPLRAESEYMAAAAYDASDPDAVHDARKREAAELRERLDYLATIMSTPAGRKWIYQLLAECRIFESPVVVGDPYFTYHNIGGQNIGKLLLQDLNDASPDGYILMMREATERRFRV